MNDFRLKGIVLAGILVGCSGSSNNATVSGQGGGGGAQGSGGGASTVGTNAGTGGAATSAATGGNGGTEASGTKAGTGGAAIGGATVNTGGTKASSGGTNAGSGGTAAAGATANTGGATASSGGTKAGVGGSATGGAAGGTKASSGGTKASSGGTKAGVGGTATGGSNTGGTKAATGGTAANTGGTNAGSGGGTSTRGYRMPTANAGFDYQIGGAYTPPTGVQVVSRDRNSSPAAGLYNICYINGFQAQPDEENFWQTQHPDLLLHDSSGNVVVDADWNEMLLDTSTAAKRTALAAVLGVWIAKCASDGFDAVEVDNLDSYSRSTGLLTQANNVAMMTLLSTAAHAAGLAIAQKNSTELLGNAAAMGTDFAIAEECNRYSECTDYQAVYGNLVFVIEYRSQDFQKGCTDHPELSIVLRDLNVSPAGSAGYVYQGC